MPRIYISDLILLQDPHTKRINAIMDANSPAWNRTPPQSLLNKRMASMRLYGRVSNRIRCIRCGKRFVGAGPHFRYCDHCDANKDNGLVYYSAQNWSGRLANDRRRYQLEGLLGRGHSD